MTADDFAVILVQGWDEDGELQYAEPLGHGEDPVHALRAAGWEPRWIAGDRVAEQLVLRFAVQRGEHAEPHQRAAAYAVVVAPYDGEPCLLLTSFVNSRSLRWALPGGGIDPGEEPVVGLHREVWEETGQEIVIDRPHAVLSNHWVGKAPSGRHENFHAVRMVYIANCPEPSEPIVHDVGGSTDAALWAPISGLGTHPPLQPWTAQIVTDVVTGRHGMRG